MTDCIFCKIINKEIPSTTIYEDDQFLAFNDINPSAKTHILLIPKKHYESVADLKEKDVELIGNMILVANKIAKEQGIDESGYRLVTNAGPDSGQLINHLHFHILGGEKLGRIA